MLDADQVVMKNGDRLTGTIVKSDAKTLVLKSEYAGPVTLPWEAVTGIESAAPLSIGLADGQMVVGSASLAEGRLRVVTQNAGTVSSAKESVLSIRSKEEQAAYEQEIDRYRNPRLIDLWAGFLDLGYAQTQGNADTTTINVSASANRVTTRDKIGVTFTSLYASNSTTGVSLVTANAIRGGVNYNLNLTPKLFTFGSVDLEFDEFQSLDLRFVPAGGFGYRPVKTERTQFDVKGGGALNREFFSTGLRRTSGEALLGEEVVHKMNGVTTLRQAFYIFPNLTNTGSYRMNFDLSASTAFRKWLAWQVTLSDRFLSNPVPGRQKNDVLFTTGVRLTFAK